MRFILPLFLLMFYACSPSTESSNDGNDGSPSNTEETMPNNEDEFVYEDRPIEVQPEVSNDNSTSTEYEDVDWDDYMESMTKDFSFAIIISTKDYDAALERAKDASEKLGYPLNLRELVPNDEIGLTLPEEVCTGICGSDEIEFPQYLPRNDWGESKYVSIEYSNGFEGFTPGYYIVVVASGEKDDPIIDEALEEAQQYYEDAYAKTCGVWVGCGC